MFRIYSKACEYAFRALMLLPQQGDTTRFQAKEVCERAGIPEPFTRKVFQALVQAGILSAVRGPGGGYELTRPPEAISMLDVIKAVDGDDVYDLCAMGLPNCGRHNPCPLHGVWASFKSQLLAQLAGKNLQDLFDFAVRGAASSDEATAKTCLCNPGLVHHCAEAGHTVESREHAASTTGA